MDVPGDHKQDNHAKGPGTVCPSFHAPEVPDVSLLQVLQMAPHAPWDFERNFSGGREQPKYSACIVFGRYALLLSQREESTRLYICVNGVLVTDVIIPPEMIERVFHYIRGHGL